MPIEVQGIAHRLWRYADIAFAYLLTGSLWASLAWLGWVIASRRWSGAPMGLSVSVSIAAAAQGTRCMVRIADRSDALVMDYLLKRYQIEDAEPWAIFPQEEQVIKTMHLSHCLSRWGINARSSGWGRFCRSFWWDVASVPVCVLLAVHPWWFAL
jgi:hypothetical protein